MATISSDPSDAAAAAFKAYDIRGTYGSELTEELAFAVGRALVDELQADRIVVGRDMRPHGTPLSESLIEGIRRQGATAIDLGIVSTPMLYHANVSLAADGAVMVTASHNPAPDNGMKITRADAIPMGFDSGLRELQRRIREANYAIGRPRGSLQTHDIKPAYRDLMRRRITFSGHPRIVLDFGNAMGSVEMDGLLDAFDATVLFGELDGSFPNHLANPLRPDTMRDLQAAVRERGALFGVAFDGDADRVGFVDETGSLVRIDLVTALIAADYLLDEPGAAIVHDVRTGRAVREFIRARGGKPVEWRVGHAYMKRKMRELNAPFGGELAGHYYFRELSTSESTALVLIKMANLLAREQLPMSALFAPLQGWVSSGEINVELPDRSRIEPTLAALREQYRDGELSDLDGIRVDFDHWWFNARPSNTEPYLRLLVEADTRETMQAKRDELVRLVREGL